MEPVIHIQGLNHYFGQGQLRKQILFDLCARIEAGEIVIMTPSGSGKTTLLTLIGALRSAQEGSLRVLGQELRNATKEQQIQIRRQTGYIFQGHNLLHALTARQNVQMALDLQPHLSPQEVRERVEAMLCAVGLGERLDYYPHELSGGKSNGWRSPALSWDIPKLSLPMNRRLPSIKIRARCGGNYAYPCPRTGLHHFNCDPR